MLANGLSTSSVGTFGEAIIPNLGIRLDGFIETVKSVEEIVVGTGLIENMKIIFNYCVKRMEISGCKRVKG